MDETGGFSKAILSAKALCAGFVGLVVHRIVMR